MRKLGIIISLIGIAHLTACDKKNSTTITKETTETSSEAPKPDLSTPEKAIYSFQSFKNWSEEWKKIVGKKYLHDQEDKFNQIKYSLFQDRSAQILKQERERFLQDQAEKFEFTIAEMKKETDTRVVAIVNVRNVTPIVAGAVVDEFDKKRRADGVKFKFDLELENAKWLISQITEWEEYSNKWEPIIKRREPTVDSRVYLP